MTKPTVGIIGLGAMGAGIAKTLRNNGFTIHVCDVRPGVADAFVADGGTAHATTAALAAVSDVVVSVVVNAAQTESVLFGDDGKGGAASAMRPGSTFVMCSTVDPNWSVALEARLNALGPALCGRPHLRRCRQGRVGPDDDDDLGQARGLCRCRHRARRHGRHGVPPG